MASYCEQRDLYDHGLPRGAIPNPARQIAGVHLDANAIEIDSHGLDLDTVVRFRADVGGDLPRPLVEGVSYYARPVDDSRFRVALGLSTDDPPGELVQLESCGYCPLMVLPLPIAAAISWGARVIDEAIPAHATELVEPYPEIIRTTNAELAAWKLGLTQGARSASLAEIVAATTERLKRWARGTPVRGAQATQKPTNLAVAATRPYRDSRGWSEFGGT